MEFVYLACATLGGTVLVLQFVMSVLGLGSESGFDVDGDVPDDFDIVDDAGNLAAAHGSTWIFAVISFKTLVAASAFFGIAGMATTSAGWSAIPSLGVAIVAGVAAMFVVHWMMRGLYKLNQDGSLRLEKSVGRRGSVYIPIPAQQKGEGKIQIRLQGRIVEVTAVSNHSEPLPTGAKVQIIRVLTPRTVEVERIPDTKIVEGGKHPTDATA